MQLLLDGAVVLDVGAVAPLALGGWRRRVPAAASAAAAVALAPGRAGGLLAVPVLAAAVAAVRDASLLDPVRLDPIRFVAATWSVVAAGALVASTLGWSVLGHAEPIVRLTAVHFLFAGTGALVLAGASRSRLAVAATGLGPLVVAFGFVTGWAVPQVGGAVLLAVGVLATAAAQVREAFAERHPVLRRILLAASGTAVWAPMVLAVTWAAAQHADVPALSIPDMARWHGASNAIGFVLCGLLARSATGAGER